MAYFLASIFLTFIWQFIRYLEVTLSAKNHCGLSLIYTWTTDKQLLCSSLASFSLLKGFSGSSNGKESVYNAGRPGFNSWVRKVPWRRAWQPTPVFLPGESHGQRSLVGYSSRGRRVGHDWATSTHTMGYKMTKYWLPECREALA